MANFAESMKDVLLKGIEAIGKGANTVAEGAQQKISEINLQTRRREALGEVTKLVCELHHQGVELPQELTALLNEVDELTEKIKALRPAAQKPAAEEAAPAEEGVEVCEECTPEQPAAEEDQPEA